MNSGSRRRKKGRRRASVSQLSHRVIPTFDLICFIAHTYFGHTFSLVSFWSLSIPNACIFFPLSISLHALKRVQCYKGCHLPQIVAKASPSAFVREVAFCSAASSKVLDAIVSGV